MTEWYRILFLCSSYWFKHLENFILLKSIWEFGEFLIEHSIFCISSELYDKSHIMSNIENNFQSFLLMIYLGIILALSKLKNWKPNKPQNIWKPNHLSHSLSQFLGSVTKQDLLRLIKWLLILFVTLSFTGTFLKLSCTRRFLQIEKKNVDFKISLRISCLMKICLSFYVLSVYFSLNSEMQI